MLYLVHVHNNESLQQPQFIITNYPGLSCFTIGYDTWQYVIMPYISSYILWEKRNTRYFVELLYLEVFLDKGMRLTLWLFITHIYTFIVYFTIIFQNKSYGVLFNVYINDRCLDVCRMHDWICVPILLWKHFT